MAGSSIGEVNRRMAARAQKLGLTSGPGEAEERAWTAGDLIGLRRMESTETSKKLTSEEVATEVLHFLKGKADANTAINGLANALTALAGVVDVKVKLKVTFPKPKKTARRARG